MNFTKIIVSGKKIYGQEKLRKYEIDIINAITKISHEIAEIKLSIW